MGEPLTPEELEKCLVELSQQLERTRGEKEEADAKIRVLELQLERANHELELVDGLSKL